ncbi:AAA family ATPase [Fervidibacillus halotolerans]|uniref:MoxR family ATPase n=1 Tax=Fervidibacillus halotolerans TaxID=2980027 RepID=A0A9E8M2Y9_9BACI|nr:MoxR family ATPase [Fervidibacillus halotolerans]WAA13631.1 MoxR family ATPase [Fervidibacillus halotolerans]
MSIQNDETQFLEAKTKLLQLKDEIQRFIVGQSETIDQLLWTIFSGGHALLEGLPGLGKTMLVRTLSECLHLSFRRIQFTPDLMPSDITGTMILERDDSGKQRFFFHEGPIFHHIILADEINRATPKTQSALLEAMGERTVTVMGETRPMKTPFFVLATQNPIDMEGTYPLPEAQKDRFLSKIIVPYPSKEELKEIALKTTGTENIVLNRVMDVEDVLHYQQLAKKILISEDMLHLAVLIISATHPDDPSAPEMVKSYVQYGSGPRGLQSLIQMAKTRALFSGRYAVSTGDLKRVSFPVLRHRIYLNFEGEAEGITPEMIISNILEKVTESGG